MKKYLSILLLVMLTGLSLNLVKTTKTDAFSGYMWQGQYEKRGIGANQFQRFKYDGYFLKTKGKEVKYVIQGSSGISAQQMYDAIPPLTWSEASNLANVWNGASSNEKLVISVQEDSSCRWNPSVCGWKSYYKSSYKTTTQSYDNMWTMMWD